MWMHVRHLIYTCTPSLLHTCTMYRSIYLPNTSEKNTTHTQCKREVTSFQVFNWTKNKSKHNNRYVHYVYSIVGPFIFHILLCTSLFTFKYATEYISALTSNKAYIHTHTHTHTHIMYVVQMHLLIVRKRMCVQIAALYKHNLLTKKACFSLEYRDNTDMKFCLTNMQPRNSKSFPLGSRGKTKQIKSNSPFRNIFSFSLSLSPFWKIEVII